VRLAARRQRERYCRSGIRGNHMNLGGPSATGLADRLQIGLARRELDARVPQITEL
jgi:hypothetical protein